MPLSMLDTIEDLLQEAAKEGLKTGNETVELILERGESRIALLIQIKELNKVASKEAGVIYKH